MSPADHRRGTTVSVAMVLTVSAGGVWAETKITVTREES